MNIDSLVVAVAAAVAIGVPVLWWFAGRRSRQQAIARVERDAARVLDEAKRDAARVLDEAKREAETKLREADVLAKERLLQARAEFEKASRSRREELETLERRLTQKDDSLERRLGEVADREKQASRLEREMNARAERHERAERQLETQIAEQRTKLEQLAGLTAQQAKGELISSLEDEARLEAAHLVKRIEDEARENGSKEAQRIIGVAVQRAASDYVSETTVSVVMLPNDEMKGRIIGREGRNIRALEAATGVDLIVDDTPEAVILSGFDPYRREIARTSLERLIADGRIHPARIEEVVQKVETEIDQRVRQEGEAALLELNIPNVHRELVKLLGKLRFRTSYGQNVLQHSKDVAFLASTMAAELKGRVQVAKRAGLFHDIGKAVDREFEGGHVEIGIDLLRKHGESEAVVHAMSTHHGDYDPETVEAVLVTAADALSAARPGARREILETYVKRLEKLEEIAAEFKGVRKTFAMQAGREIRVIVDSNRIKDEEAIWLSKDIARKVEAELTYPGQIKVTVIRETRSTEYAK